MNLKNLLMCMEHLNHLITFTLHTMIKVSNTKGDFLYHQLCVKNKMLHHFYDEGVLQSGDCMIISVPFSDSGNEPEDLYYILEECEQKNIQFGLLKCI